MGPLTDRQRVGLGGRPRLAGVVNGPLHAAGPVQTDAEIARYAQMAAATSGFL